MTWTAQTVRLNFRLGELTLWRVGQPFMVHTANNGELAGGEPPFSFYEWPSSIRGALLRSHPTGKTLPRRSTMPEAIRYVPQQYERCTVDLQGPFDDYLQKFSPKSRSTLKRKVRRFAEYCGGMLRCEVYRRPEEMETFHRLAREVSAKTYQEQLLQAGLPTGDSFRNEMKTLASQGRVRAFILFNKDKPVAYLYCPIADDVLQYAYLGYDPACRQWSPGTVLQYCALESLFTEGCFRAFDFGEGEAPHKTFFATSSVRCADIYYFKKTMRNRLLIRSHMMVDSLSSAVGAILDGLNLKPRIRRWLRHGV